MPTYTPEQLTGIRRAVAKARAAMQRENSFTPLTFARTYIARGGVQIPGEDGDDERCRRISEAIIHVLEHKPAGIADDPLIARELERVTMEVEWARASRSDKVVGFRLVLGPEANRRPECLALLSRDRGLGPAVFAKGEVAVLPPSCDGSRFVAVLEDELEQ